MFTLPPASLAIKTINDVRVDRDSELSLISNALIVKGHNVLLYGERGTGKTFLVRLIEDEILRNVSTVIPVTVNMFSLLAYSPHDISSAFPRAVLLQICVELWKTLLGKDYLELRERLEDTGQEVTLRSKAEKTIQRIYSTLMTQVHKSKFEMMNSIGFSTGIKGEKRELKSSEKQQADVLPFEFLEFVDELNSYVLREYGKSKILVLCDEANHFSVSDQREILERYFELFLSKSVQFLCVLGVKSLDSVHRMPDSFETKLELTGLANKSWVKELLGKYFSGCEITFTDDALDILYTRCQGHPRSTLEICERAVAWLKAEGQSEMNGLLMRLICTEYELAMKGQELPYKMENE